MGGARVLKQYLSRIILFLIAVEASIVASAILSAPSEAANVRLLGLSTSRLAMLGGVLLFALAALGLLLYSFWRKSPFDIWEASLRGRFSQPKTTAVSTILLGFFAWAAAELAIYAGVVQEPVMQAVLMRLQPLLIGGALIAAELLLLILSWHWIENKVSPWQNRELLYILILWGIFILVGVFQTLSGYGFTQETTETGVFRLPGTPILGIQIVLALVFVFWGGKWLWPRIVSTKVGSFINSKSGWLNLGLGILIWGIAFAVWMAAPLKESWFVDGPRAPNYTFSPNSDAYLYESVAHSLLVGSEFQHPQWGYMVLRPVYSSILALFHWIGGLEYEDIIWLQVAALSFFPVLVFRLTTILHRRLSGMLAALLIIFREYNSISLADTITVSHAKLLMADLPVTLGIVLVLLLFVRWIQNPGHRWLPLLAGGAIGFFLMVRMEAAALLALPVISAIYFVPRYTKNWLQGIGFLFLGFGLIMAPWVYRNWGYTQMFYLVSPEYEQQIIDKIFGTKPLQGTSALGIGIGAGTEKNLFSERGDVILTNDDGSWSAGERRLNHYFNNQLQAFMYFPLSPRLLLSFTTAAVTRQTDQLANLCCSPEAYVRDLPYWWNDWDGKLKSGSILSMGVVMLILAAGVLALWRTQKLLSLLPILFAIAYLIFLSVLGRSGGRWLLEVDWVNAIIFSVGSVGIFEGFTNWVSGENSQLPKNTLNVDVLVSPRRIYLVAVLLLIIGLIVPLSEQFIIQRYTQAGIDARLDRLLSDQSSHLSETDKEKLITILAEEGVETWYGRALYPRFFQGGDGMDGLGGIYKRPFSRMEFFLVGTENHWTTIAQPEPVDSFPHGADVLLVGQGAYYSFDIQFGVVFDEGMDFEMVLWKE